MLPEELLAVQLVEAVPEEALQLAEALAEEAEEALQLAEANWAEEALQETNWALPALRLEEAAAAVVQDVRLAAMDLPPAQGPSTSAWSSENFGRWSRCSSPVPVTKGDLCRSQSLHTTAGPRTQSL